MSLYIAPEGAMQFELNAREAAIAGEMFIWVMPLEGVMGCRNGHLKEYQVVNAPDKAVRYSRDVLGNDVSLIPTVCACHGRIIE